jgi:hypothetical protein
VQDRIAEAPSLLGLGDLVLKDKERIQPRAGRLDLLLQDPDANKRYEVEVQLGKSDEAHIIRTIEYWDIERKRYPQYDHTAVIVAEDITTRFLNVITLFNGSIPLVAIQMKAMKPEMKTIEVELRRTIPASSIEVFDGWLDPKCPGTPWSEADKLVFDLKVDGLFYWLFINEAGERKPHYGRFTILDRPSKVQRCCRRSRERFFLQACPCLSLSLLTPGFGECTQGVLLFVRHRHSALSFPVLPLSTTFTTLSVSCGSQSSRFPLK